MKEYKYILPDGKEIVILSAEYIDRSEAVKIYNSYMTICPCCPKGQYVDDITGECTW